MDETKKINPNEGNDLKYLNSMEENEKEKKLTEEVEANGEKLEYFTE